MNKIVKAQLVAFVAFCLYFLIRLIGVDYQPDSLWQYFFWGILIKDSAFLVFVIFFIYYLFNLLRRGQPTGPTIVSSRKLKVALYLVLGLWWLAIILHILFDPLSAIFRLANFLDETISHIFLYTPIILISFIGLLLEIERPLAQALSKIDTWLIYFLSSLAGIMWGLNLTEGRLSLITSFPLSGLYLILVWWLFKKYHLKFNLRPFTLTCFIVFLVGGITFSIWGIKFSGFPEFFNYLK